VITPRFSPCCTSELLKKLGHIAKNHDLLVQTHLAENQKEIVWNKVLFPEFSNYTDVYEKHDLLGPKTILAHCIYLSNEECQQILYQQSGISHCPNSNTSL
jgi:guanine deaminase